MPVPATGGTGAPATPVVNVANLLTAVRLVLVPVFAVLLLGSHGTSVPWRVAACAVFLVASLTDLYDGRLARSRNLVTRFGTVADPIADKALTGAALCGLSALGLLPWWVTAVIVAREVGVTLLRFWVIRHGVIAASRGGKLKTLVQVIAISWYLLPWPESVASLGPWIMAVAVVVTVATGADYVARALALRRAAAGHRPAARPSVLPAPPAPGTPEAAETAPADPSSGTGRP